MHTGSECPLSLKAIHNLAQTSEDYAAMYKNIVEELKRPDNDSDPDEEPVWDDYDLVAYSKLRIDFEYIVELNRITSANNIKHIFGTDIFRLLTQKGYVEERQIDGRLVQIQTELGLSKGIGATEKISKTGNAYTVLLYSTVVQKEIVEHYTAIRNQVESDEDDEADGIEKTSFDRVEYNRKMDRPDGAGASWTKEEEQQLNEEYSSGMKISEIAKLHERTNGAIRARLKKHGLIEWYYMASGRLFCFCCN
ncbi:MAG: hypothetical protein NC318_08070 [Blautia sp.]|nr:hypothetical protein [Lachnoclostridium sp.]MCM1211545.1 hypothetical protein [Blautia sp.]